MFKSLLRFLDSTFERKAERVPADEGLRQQALDLFDVDPYLHFNGPIYDDTPKEFIPLLDTIRRASEWQALGLNPRCTKDGTYRPIVRKGLHFGFTVVVLPDDVEMLAIKTRKKCTTSPAAVAEFVLCGCSYDDFASLSEDVKAYCEALQARDLQDSLSKIKRAIELKPEENLYVDYLAETKLKMNDLSAIDEELAYYIDDMDAMVHSGKASERLKTLISRKEYRKAMDFITVVNQALDDLIEGRRHNKRFFSQAPAFCVSEKNQFNDTLSKSTGFSRASSITDNHAPCLEFSTLIEMILGLEGPRNITFIERLGDAFAFWNDAESASKYYTLALDLVQSRPNVAGRIQRKVEKLQSLKREDSARSKA